jgi:hypothetical protein
MAREFESIEYRFSDDELLALGKQLARANQEIYDLRTEKKAATSSLNASIGAAEKTAAELTMKIERKAEMREVEVVPVMDKPRTGLKTMIRADTGEELRVAVMSLEEQQATIDFEGGPDEGERTDRA